MAERVTHTPFSRLNRHVGDTQYTWLKVVKLVVPVNKEKLINIFRTTKVNHKLNKH